MATLVFEIAWDPSVPATLLYLRDNGDDLLVQPIIDDDGRITLSWDADHLIAHFIDWDLWSAGNKLQALSARACWDGGAVQLLAEVDEQHHHWRKGGTL